MNDRKRRIVIGISGASGGCYGVRVVELLAKAGVEVHLVVSPLGRRVVHDEMQVELKDLWEKERGQGLVVEHSYMDVGAAIASGSFRHDGMIVVPCSSHTLGAVATGMGENLLHRAAAVTLKERRRLVLCHREMPLSLVEIRNMQQVTEAGAIVAPASPGFYMRPGSVGELVDFVAGRLLDLVGVEHGLEVRWEGSAANWRAEGEEGAG